MEWLKDKKNAPIVGAIAVVIIIGVGLCMWLFVFRPPAEAPPDQTAQQTAAPGGPAGTPVVPPATPPGVPPGTPAAATPGAAGRTPAPGAPVAGPGVQVVSIKPMETWRSDPFQPIGYKPSPVRVIKPHIWDFPYEKLPIKFKGRGGKGKLWEKPEIQQPSRRMAGILLNDRVYAIIESNGRSEVVQPGDYTLDRLAMVERIESDRVVLKTVDEKPRYITVKMAASPTISSAAPPAPSAPPMPYGPVGRPGRPSGGGPPPPP